MAIGLSTNTVQTGGGTVSAGTNITGFDAPVIPDKGLTKQTKPRVFKAQFGDGYEVRAVNGINNTPRSFSLSFATREKEKMDDLIAFFTTLAGVSTCQLTMPDSNDADGLGNNEETIKIVVDSFSQSYPYDNFYSVSCEAREVFEP